jgi:hypothetical protein
MPHTQAPPPPPPPQPTTLVANPLPGMPGTFPTGGGGAPGAGSQDHGFPSQQHPQQGPGGQQPTQLLVALADLRRRVEALEATSAEASKALAASAREAPSSTTGGTQFYGLVGAERVLVFDEIPAGGEISEETAKAAAKKGQWIVLFHPVTHVERKGNLGGAVTDVWARTSSVAPDGSTKDMWVRFTAEDNTTKAFKKLAWYPHEA